MNSPSFMQSNVSNNNNSRINRISDKLVFKKQQEGEENEQRITKGLERTENINYKIDSFFNTLNTSINDIKTQIDNIKEKLNQRRQQSEEFFGDQQENIFQIENIVLENISDLNEQQKNHQETQIQGCEQEVGAVKEQIQSLDQIQEKDLNRQVIQKIKKSIPHAQSVINMEQLQRGECDNIILEKYSEKLKTSFKEVQQLETLQNQQQQQIFEEAKLQIKLIRDNIKLEQDKRQSNEETILALIQTTMNKFNSIEKQVKFQSEEIA